MTGQLFLPGWELEPCDTADPDEQAFTDLHGQQPRAYRTTVTVQAPEEYL